MQPCASLALLDHCSSHRKHANTSQVAPGKSAKVLDILTHRRPLTAPDIPATDAAVVPVASAGICARKARAGHGGHRWAAEELPLADVIRQVAGERRVERVGEVGGFWGGGVGGVGSGRLGGLPSWSWS